jgi:pseudaminic acid cytidylyltransferase
VNLAYIQARAGSKRFPKKALALWKGKPMVADAIEKAQATGLFDYIAVSSDDPEVLQIAVDYGVLPLWRSPAAASDTATDDDVAAEVLRYFPKVDIVCKLYPCIPLVDKYDIKTLVEYYKTYESPVHFVDIYFKDAGSVYVFSKKTFDIYHSLALNAFAWSACVTYTACDINTPEDLEIAKLKAGI